jgi:hypothetical protein
MSEAVTQKRPGKPHQLLSPTFLLIAVAAFMVATDNLVVVTALPACGAPSAPTSRDHPGSDAAAGPAAPRRIGKGVAARLAG